MYLHPHPAGDTARVWPADVPLNEGPFPGSTPAPTGTTAPVGTPADIQPYAGQAPS